MITNRFIIPFEFALGFKIIFPSLPIGIDIQMVKRINKFNIPIFKSTVAKRKCQLSSKWNKKWDENLFSLRVKRCSSCPIYIDVEDYPSKGKERRKNICKECDNRARRIKYGSEEKNELEIILEFSDQLQDKTMIVNTVYELIKPKLTFNNQSEEEVDVEALIRPTGNLLIQ